MHRVHRPERVATVILDYLDDVSTAEPRHRLRIAMPTARLCYVQRVSDVILDSLRKVRKSRRLEPTQITGFKLGSFVIHCQSV